MAIVTEIIRLRNNRDTIRSQVLTWGLGKSTDTLSTLATIISGISKQDVSATLTVSNPTVTLAAGYYDGTGTVGITLETKSVTPSTTAQTITPTSNKVLSSVTVGAIQTQTLTVIPSASQQIKTPDTGKFFSQVTVNAIPGEWGDATTTDAVAGDILYGKKAIGYNSTTGKSVLLTGSMPNNGSLATTTLDTSIISYTIPAGYTTGGTVNISLETKSVTPTTSPQTVTPTSGKVLSIVSVSAIQTQTETITPTTSQQVVNPDEGKYLSQVTVNKIPENFGNATDKTATNAQILYGYTAIGYNSSTGKAIDLTGSMANNGAVSVNLDTETTSYTVPAGYHNGSGTVSITTQNKTITPTTASQTVTPDSNKVLASVLVNPIQTETKDATPATSQQVITPASGKYLSSVTVNAIPIKFGDASGTDAVAANLLYGKTAIGYNSSTGAAITLTGTMPNNAPTNTTLSTATTSYTIPAGYHAGTGTVNISLETKSTAPSESPQTITPTSGKVLSSVSISAIKTETTSITPTTSQQIITPSAADKYLKQVTVNAIPAEYGDATEVTATADKILYGETAIGYDSTEEEAVVLIGTMPNRGAVGVTLNTSTSSYTVPAGYHNGSGTVSIDLEAKSNINPTDSSQTITPTSGKVLSSVQINGISYSDAPTVTLGFNNLTASTVKGRYNAGTNNITIGIGTGNNALTGKAAHVLAGYKVIGLNAEGDAVASITGTMVNHTGAENVTLTTASTSYTIPAGYHAGSQVVSLVTETKVQAPGDSDIIVTPTGDKVLSAVTVKGITYTDAQAYTLSYSTLTASTAKGCWKAGSSNITLSKTGLTGKAAHVLAGYKVIGLNAAGTAALGFEGTMPDHTGAVNVVLDATTKTAGVLSNTSYTIPAGYHAGSQTVSIVTETKEQTPGLTDITVTPSNERVLSSVVVKAIPNQQSAISYTLDATHNNQGTYTNTSKDIPVGYYSTAGAVSISIQEPVFIPTFATTAGTDIYYPDSEKVFGKVTVNKVVTETPTITLAPVDGTTINDTYTPSTGKLFSSVTVPRIATETKTVTASTSDVTVTPTTSGKYLTQVVVHPTPTETKTVSPIWVSGTTTSDTYTPGSGKYFSSFTVNRIDNKYQDVSGVTAGAGQVLTGYAFVTSSGTLTNGTMADRGAVSVKLDATTKTSGNLSNISYTVPAGYHNGSGTVYIDPEAKANINPSDSSQTITPTSGKVLASVQINGISYSDAPTITLGYGTLSASTVKGRYNAGSNNVTIGIGTGNNTLTGKAAHVLAGYRVIGIDNAGTAVASVEGSMPDHSSDGNVSLTTASSSHTVPAGYHAGSQIISVSYEAKTVTPTNAGFTVSGTSNKFLSSVTVNPIPESTALTNAIIAGTAFVESEEGAEITDYGWKTTVTIPAGHWNSQQVIEKTFSNIFPSLSTDAATAAEMLLGYKAYNSAGQVITGSMANNGAGATYTLDTSSTSKTLAAGYWSSANTVKIVTETKTNINPSDSSQTITPTGNKVLASVQINGITYSDAPAITLGYGTLSASTAKGRYKAGSSNVTIGLGSGNTQLTAKAAHILSGYRAIGTNAAGTAVASVEGTMTNNGAVTPTITTQGDHYTIPAGYHNGEGYVTASINNGTLVAKSASVSVSDTRDITLGNAQASAPATGPYIKVSGSGTVKVSTDGYLAANVEKTATATDQYYPVTNVLTLDLTFADNSTASYTLIGNNVTVS